MYLSGVTGFCVHVCILEVAKGHGDQGRRFLVLPNLSLRHMKSGVSAVHIFRVVFRGFGESTSHGLSSQSGHSDCVCVSYSLSMFMDVQGAF